jgi:hypothetical protein
VIRIRPVKAIEPMGNVAGPSRPSEDKAKGSKGKGKGKAKEVREDEDYEGMDEGAAMRRRHIAARLAQKRVDLEMLLDEIEGLEGLMAE